MGTAFRWIKTTKSCPGYLAKKTWSFAYWNAKYGFSVFFFFSILGENGFICGDVILSRKRGHIWGALTLTAKCTLPWGSTLVARSRSKNTGKNAFVGHGHPKQCVCGVENSRLFSFFLF